MELIITVDDGKDLNEVVKLVSDRGIAVRTVLTTFGAILGEGDPNNLVGIEGIQFRRAEQMTTR